MDYIDENEDRGIFAFAIVMFASSFGILALICGAAFVVGALIG